MDGSHLAIAAWACLEVGGSPLRLHLVRSLKSASVTAPEALIVLEGKSSDLVSCIPGPRGCRSEPGVHLQGFASTIGRRKFTLSFKGKPGKGVFGTSKGLRLTDR